MPDLYTERAGEEAERIRLISDATAVLQQLPMSRLRRGVKTLPYFTEAKAKKVARFLKEHWPDMSIDEIADTVGLDRSTLYRDRPFRLLIALQSGEIRLPRGSKDKDGNLEAYDHR